MNSPQALLARLEAIGRSLERSGHGLALIGLGSVGLELERLDAFSDLDFFAIVEEGWAAGYIANLNWLSEVAPIAYCFRNTADGYKLLYEDGIFCEFAVFEPGALGSAVFAPGRVVWKQPHVPDTIGASVFIPAPPEQRPLEWMVGEILTNLYVGLGRLQRGEALSAMRFIQGYPVDRIVELAPRLERESPANADPFTPERRFEQRFPGLGGELASFMQGYARSRESALAILGYLERHCDVNARMAEEIRRLCE